MCSILPCRLRFVAPGAPPSQLCAKEKIAGHGMIPSQAGAWSKMQSLKLDTTRALPALRFLPHNCPTKPRESF